MAKKQPLENPAAGHIGIQSVSSEFLQRKTVSWNAEERMRTGTELLFLPHRFFAGSDWLVQIQRLILHCGYFGFSGCAVGACGMRLSVPLWVVSGAASQNTFQEIQYPPAAHSDISEIRGSVKHYAQNSFGSGRNSLQGAVCRPLVFFQRAGCKGSRAAVRRLSCP